MKNKLISHILSPRQTNEHPFVVTYFQMPFLLMCLHDCYILIFRFYKSEIIEVHIQ